MTISRTALCIKNEGEMSCEVREVSSIGVPEWNPLHIGGPTYTAYIIDFVHLYGSYRRYSISMIQYVRPIRLKVRHLEINRMCRGKVKKEEE
jgi:hypothetical protein